MIAYRTPGPADAAALSTMARDSFVETFGTLYAREDLDLFVARAFGAEGLARDIDDPAFRLRIALDGAALVAFVKLGRSTLPPPATADDLELKQLYVLRGWQGTGVAAALMEWALEQARAQAAPRLLLSVYADNLRAQRFYARYGFGEIGRNAFRVGSQIDDDRIWSVAL